MDDILVVYEQMPQHDIPEQMPRLPGQGEYGRAFLIPAPQHGRGRTMHNVGQAKRLTAARLPFLKSVTAKDIVLVCLSHDVSQP